jgi:hypothetical protein
VLISEKFQKGRRECRTAKMSFQKERGFLHRKTSDQVAVMDEKRRVRGEGDGSLGGVAQ